MLPVSIYLTPDGLEMIEGPGVTISDLRNQYPGCGLIEVNRPDISHDSDLFTLVPGVLYQITLPITEGKPVRDLYYHNHIIDHFSPFSDVDSFKALQIHWNRQSIAL